MFEDPLQINGQGIIGVHQYPESTGIFSVIPTKIIDLKEGFYPFSFSKSIYSNMNPQLIINRLEHVNYEEFEKIVGSRCKGMGITGLMTSPIWGFKETKGLFF